MQSPANIGTCVEILLAEYRALNGLLNFRMQALDRRTPVVTGLLAVLLGTLKAMEPPIARALLGGIPIGLFALTMTTVNHARSQEDLLRRIEEIERRLNRTVRLELIGFQSSHPSRHRKVGGRTGTVTVQTIVLISVVTLVMSAYVFGTLCADRFAQTTYNAYSALSAIAIVTVAARLQHYKYRNTNGSWQRAG